MSLFGRPLILGALFFVSQAASASEFGTLIPEHSSLGFVVRQMNVPVEGRFRAFRVGIALDPEKPQVGHANVEVDLASIDTGTPEADSEAKSRGWFDVRTHPTARFVSERVTSIAPGRFEVSGKLSLKGRVQPITVPFALTPSGQNMLLEGSFPLRRLQFGIGEGEWSDPSVVSDEVLVRFRLVLAPGAHR